RSRVGALAEAGGGSGQRHPRGLDARRSREGRRRPARLVRPRHARRFLFGRRTCRAAVEAVRQGRARIQPGPARTARLAGDERARRAESRQPRHRPHDADRADERRLVQGRVVAEGRPADRVAGAVGAALSARRGETPRRLPYNSSAMARLHPFRALPADADPYSKEVYDRAAKNFDTLRQRALVVEDEASVYFYRLRMGGHVQTGLAACFGIDDYDRDVIKKHERTRRDKEDDRTRHMMALGAQTGPVFLTYRANGEVDRIAERATSGPPLIDFTAPDGVQHTLWRVGGADRDALVAAFGRIPTLYIADGHHRAASAARARDEIRQNGAQRPSLGDGADASTMLAVAF